MKSQLALIVAAVLAESRALVAAEAVAKAPKDGYTLFMAALPNIAITPAMQKVSFHPLNDFAAVSNVGLDIEIQEAMAQCVADCFAQTLDAASGSWNLAGGAVRNGTVVEREYAVRLLGEPTDTQLQQLQEGIELDNGAAKVAAIEPGGRSGSNAWYHVTLRETRHRDLRPALAAVGLAVSRVIRVRYDTIALGDLYRGSSRPLTPAESRSLYAVAGLEARRAEPRGAKTSP